VNDTMDMLYTRTASGLIVPRSAVSSPNTAQIAPAVPALSRQQRRHLERNGLAPVKRCGCGKVISGNREKCLACEVK
jgi:hypothetical protein